MDRRAALDRLCAEHGLLAIYVFGSRTDDGAQVLRGEDVQSDGSDLDVGIYFADAGLDGDTDLASLPRLQLELDEIFHPLSVDVVPLDRVDALFQFRAIDGIRVATPDSTVADFHELAVMRRAAELLPIQRAWERERFGVSTW